MNGYEAGIILGHGRRAVPAVAGGQRFPVQSQLAAKPLTRNLDWLNTGQVLPGH